MRSFMRFRNFVKSSTRLKEMLARSQKRTVPQVYIDDRYIGGYEELAAADRSGGLAQTAGDAA